MGGITLDRQILNEPKEKYWISYIKSRIKKNKNFLGFISGQTGSGKSWSTISICEQLDENFNENNIVFSGLELMKLINSGKLKRGSAICFEEVGVEMNNKNWASVTNKMLNYLIQTFRHRGFILIMNSPYMDFVDSSVRKLFHAEMSTVGIDFKQKLCKIKPQLIQYNGRIKKYYYKRLKVITKKGVIPIQFWNVEKPSQKIIKIYEKKKKDYTDNLNKEIFRELKQLQIKKENKKGWGASLTDIQQETLDLLKQGNNIQQVADIRGKAHSVIGNCIKCLKIKGYKFKPVLKGRTIDHYKVIEPQFS